MRVSVIVPTRNRTDLLTRALRSVKAQTHPDIDLIVIDDSDTDAARAANLALVRDIVPQAIYLLLPAESAGQGPGFPRNHGIAQSSGDHIAFLDDDDEWVDPAYLESATAAMTRHGFDVYLADQQAVHPNGDIQPPPIWTEDWATMLPQAGLNPADDGSYLLPVEKALLSQGFAHLNTTIVSRSLLRDRLHGFDLSITYEEDRELYFRLLDHGQAIGYTPRTVARHYIPAGSNRPSASNTVPDEEKDASRLRWLNGLISTASRQAVRDRSLQERVYTLKRIATRAARKGNLTEARQYGLEALRSSFGVKWLGYMAWLYARGMMPTYRPAKAQ